MTVKSGISSEQSLIRELFEPLTHIGHMGTPDVPMRSDVHFAKKMRKPLSFGLQDDCALNFIPENKELIISKDMLVEGVHFIGSENPGDIARKALRVNLSDIISGGGIPYGYMLGLSMGDKQTKEWLQLFVSGLKSDQQYYTIPLLGGDMVRTTGPLTISITILGLTDPGAYVTRGEAQVGDFIYVSGTIGDAALGLKLALNMAGQGDEPLPWLGDVSTQQAEYLIKRYHLPEPPCELSHEIAQFCTSAMDISDGLMIDTEALCEASQVGADIDMTQIPLSENMLHLRDNYKSVYDMILTGGDDYEVLCTVPANLGASFEQACKAKNKTITQIGIITENSCRFLGEDGATYEPEIKGYSHLA